LYIEADRTAEALNAVLDIQLSKETLLAALPDSFFSYGWLPVLQAAVPSNVFVTAIDIQNAGVTITAETSSLRLAEKHRAAIVTSGLFIKITYGAFTRQKNGQYRYILLAEAGR
jgi:hypothetical protein